MCNTKFSKNKAFTLIELSIVLVIIGLIVGGVLVGRDLIKAAEVRAQIVQFQDIQTATATFKTKYNFFPGDIREPDATQFGFTARGSLGGQGDGNGLLQGQTGATIATGDIYWSGETVVAWRDLSSVKLIKGNFVTATATSTTPPLTTTNQKLYFPSGLLGADSHLYFHSTNSQNYLGIMNENTGATLSVHQAYSIDKKIDDGLPGTGRALVFYYGINNDNFQWIDFTYSDTIPTVATPASSTTCYDNGNTNGRVPTYSITYNNGNGVNCVLSIRLE